MPNGYWLNQEYIVGCEWDSLESSSLSIRAWWANWQRRCCPRNTQKTFLPTSQSRSILHPSSVPWDSLMKLERNISRTAPLDAATPSNVSHRTNTTGEFPHWKSSFFAKRRGNLISAVICDSGRKKYIRVSLFQITARFGCWNGEFSRETCAEHNICL